MRRIVGRRARLSRLALLLACVVAAARGASAGETSLQLEVVINGLPAHMIGSFVLVDGKRIGATRAELREVGLDPGAGGKPGDMVMLETLPELTYVYDARTQTLRVQTDNSRRVGHVYNAGAREPPPKAQTSWGALVNYDLYGSQTFQREVNDALGTLVTLTLDARAFSPYGVLNQSAIFGLGKAAEAPALRLDTTYQYTNVDTMTTYRAGDIISGGLENTRSIRIGGLQAQSNFAARPDLVTMPLPTMAGIAAVPSTLDVFINGIKSFTQDVPPGPYTLTNIPIVSGAGDAKVVVTDSSGKQTTMSLPFFASPNLLRPGLMSWSLEAGLPRLSYGSASDSYSATPVASATARRGLSDAFTAAAHFEGGAGVINGGVGAAFTTGTFGVATGYVAASGGAGNSGAQVSASFETQMFGFNFMASSLRSFGHFGDLASATAKFQAVPSDLLFSVNPENYRPPLAQDRAFIGRALPFDPRSTIDASFTRSLAADGELSEIAALSYSRSLPYDASVFATLFHDFGTTKSTGFFFGLSVPLGGAVSVSSGYGGGTGGGSLSSTANKTLDLENGSYGFSVRDGEGEGAYRAATGSYRLPFGVIQAGVAQSGSGANSAYGGQAEFRGSVATMGGGVFFSHWIDDGFAVVSTGSPGVQVFSENRPIGVTDANGLLLAPTLRSYQTNSLSIDPANLPLDAELDSTRAVAVVKDGGGALIDFKVSRDVASAIVTFSLPGGGFVPAGSNGRAGGGEEFVVGYDGQAFLKHLTAANQVMIELAVGVCKASFGFTAAPDQQQRIGPAPCRPEPGGAATGAAAPLSGDPIQSVLEAGRKGCATSLYGCVPPALRAISAAPDASHASPGTSR